MADKNFNQGNQSNPDWDRERNRSNQDQDWQQQQRNSGQGYGSSGYASHQRGSLGSRDVGYSGDSSRGMGSDEQDQNRVNYIPDHDENRFDSQRPYQGSAGSYGGNDFNSSYGRRDSSGYGSSSGGYGNTSGNYGNSDWDNRRGYGNMGNQQGQGNDSNRRQWQQSSNEGYGQGRQDWGRGRVDTFNDDGGQHGSYGNTGYGGTGYGNRDYNDYGKRDRSYRQSNWNDSQGYNANRGDMNYGNRGEGDRNWWDRAKDKVSSWLSDDDDNNRRNQGREYMGGHRGKGPSDYRRSQDRIKEDICDRLTDDDRVDASHIRIQMEDDAVILSGTVNSREEKRRAEDLVESISGVRNVENRLRVGSPTTASGSASGLSNREYTGNTENTGGIGNESGTTREVIRNVNTDKGKNKGE